MRPVSGLRVPAVVAADVATVVVAVVEVATAVVVAVVATVVEIATRICHPRGPFKILQARNSSREPGHGPWLP
jgi:hypothetical protein